MCSVYDLNITQLTPYISIFQEEVTAEESTDGEIEAQAYNQDSQDSIGEVST